ncbi:MAG: DUF2497 domain-containing protein [Micavibrio sp.]|nr:MAG: DUF2497 domain-containing protein [Micavibrio sp.]
MAEKKKDQEADDQQPSIEEILVSIRQIISEEDEEAEGGDEVVLTGEDEDSDTAADIDMPAEEDDYTPGDIEDERRNNTDDGDVLELHDVVEEGDSGGEVDLRPQEEDDDLGAFADSGDDDRIISENTEDQAVGAFAKLAENAFVEEHRASGIAPAGGVTLEHITRELLRPMLKEWLDRRLPSLVEELVERELKKISERSRK